MLAFLYVLYLIPLGAIWCLTLLVALVLVIQGSREGKRLRNGTTFVSATTGVLAALWYVPILNLLVPLPVYCFLGVLWLLLERLWT